MAQARLTRLAGIARPAAPLLLFLVLVPQPVLGQADDTVCLDCHQERHDDLLGGPHHIGSGPGTPVGCTACHGADARHWEDDPEAFPLRRPETLPAAEAAALCATCHMNSHQQDMQSGDPHLANEVGCLACHSVHGGDATALLARPQPELCYGCHAEIRGEFTRAYRHPVDDGIMSCGECHMASSESRQGSDQSGAGAACLDCHGEFRGPFPYEHQAAVGYSTEEGGCLTCHAPHGAHFPRMLERPYESPRPHLCAQCHTVPRHTYNMQHGAAFADVACNECHADIHGSYDNRLFADPALEAQGCFSVGCHQAR